LVGVDLRGLLLEILNPRIRAQLSEALPLDRLVSGSKFGLPTNIPECGLWKASNASFGCQTSIASPPAVVPWAGPETLSVHE
jgi:hypothetical protein